MAKEPNKSTWNDDDKKAAPAPKAAPTPKTAPAPIAPNEPYPTGDPYYPPTEGVAQNEMPPETPPVTRSTKKGE